MCQMAISRIIAYGMYMEAFIFKKYLQTPWSSLLGNYKYCSCFKERKNNDNKCK